MRIAPLRERLTFYTRVIETDDIGNETSRFLPLFSRWCSCRLLSEVEKDGVALVVTDQRLRFTLRYDKTVLALNTQETQVQYQGRFYNITSIDGTTYPRELLLIDTMKEEKHGNYRDE